MNIANSLQHCPTGRKPHPQGRGLVNNFAWTLAGRAVYALTQWALLVLFARVGGPALVGEFALVLAITAPVMVFANLQLRNLYATDVWSRHPWSTHWRVRVYATMAGAAVLLSLALCVPSLRPYAVLIGMVTCSKSVETFNDLHYGVFQRNGSMRYYAESLLARGVGGLAAATVVLILLNDLAAAVAAMAVVWALVLWSTDAPRSTRLRQRVDESRAHQPSESAFSLFRLALPLGFVSLLGSVHENMPRYVLEFYSGAEALGVYASLVYLVTAGSMIVFSAGAPAMPVLARHFSDRKFGAFGLRGAQLLGMSLGLGACSVAFAAVFGETFVMTVYGPEFAGYEGALVILMVAATFHYLLTTLMQLLTATRTLVAQPMVLTVALVTTLGVALVRVPPLGLEGAIQALLVGSAVGSIVAGVILALVLTSARRVNSSLDVSPLPRA